LTQTGGRVEHGPRTQPGRTGPPTGRGELIAGAILLAWLAVACLVVHHSPAPNALDRWGFRLFPVVRHSTWMVRVTELGGLPVLIVGSALAAVVAGGRDRVRAVACLVGPVAAVVLSEWVIKPVVGRHYAGVLTFPSGHVTAVASLGAAWTLAVPRWLRWPVAAVAAVVIILMTVSVVSLAWHYTSDALAGAVCGIGTVLVIDGWLHLAFARPTGGPSASSYPPGDAG
jgi:undecaprenyl-diphosphatase